MCENELMQVKQYDEERIQQLQRRTKRARLQVRWQPL